MKKNTKIIVAVVVIVLMVAVGCIYGFVLKRDVPEAPPADNTQTEPVTPDTPETPDDTQTDKPAVQPENPNPTGGESAVVYVPDEQSEALTPVGTNVADDSDQALVDALISAGALPSGVKVVSSGLKDGVLTLDMNDAYAEAVRSSGTTGEEMLVYSLVNTFASARNAESVMLTVDGKPLQSGHAIYDYALTPMEN